MAVRSQFVKEYEKEYAKTGSVEKSISAATKRSTMKKPVKPTEEEKKIIDRRLRKKYPQMYKPGWGKPKKKVKPTARTKQVASQVKKAGLTEKELERLVGKKLKGLGK